jgi:tyrosinase
MKNSTGDCRYQRHFSPPHCLKRNYTPFKFPQLDNEDYIHLLIQKYTSDEVEFGQFAHEVENNAHNQLHLAIGGDFKEWWAPNDPLFWLFHAQVDKIWYDWQQANPLGRYNATELDTILEPFGVRFTDIINTKNLCYAYQDYSNAKPYTIRMA